MTHYFYRVFHHDTFSQESLQLVKSAHAPAMYSVEGIHTAAEAITKVQALYPDGLSHHGNQYVLDGYRYVNDAQDVGYTTTGAMIELAYEMLRLHQFPERFSRFTSFFACDTLADAHQFRARYRGNQGTIWQVSCEQYFRADMRYLLLGAGPASTLLAAERYWQGEATANPFWKILMQGPVTVLNRVD